jgi:hypothetical protein
MDPVQPLIRGIRSLSGAPIAVGGPAISILGSEALDHLGADFVIIGEGEDSFPLLAGACQAGEGFEGVPGLCHFNGSSVVCNAPSRLEHFGASGLERWIDWAPYEKAGATWPIQTRRGCSLSCSYCTYPTIEGTACRMRDPEEVVNEIERVAKEIGPRTFEFVDSTFTVPAWHATAICEAILSRSLDVQLSTMGGNPIGIDLPLLRLMKQAGFNSIMVTPESASETMLSRYRKGFDVRQVEAAADAVRASGLASAWFFMLGGPGETRETVAETLAFIDERLTGTNCLVVVTTGVRVFAGSGLAREVGLLRNSFENAPEYYLSPEVDEEWILERINGTIARNPNVVHACEDGTSILQRLTERALCVLGQAPPYWRHMPRLLRLPPIPWLRTRYPATGAPATRDA